MMDDSGNLGLWNKITENVAKIKSGSLGLYFSVKGCRCFFFGDQSKTNFNIFPKGVSLFERVKGVAQR